MKIEDLFIKLGFQVDDSGAKKFNSIINTIKKTTMNLGKAIGAGFLVKQIIEAGAHSQEMLNIFSTMTGNVDEANNIMDKLLNTSFKFGIVKDTLEDWTKQLMYLGINGEKSVEIVEMLSNISAGIGQDKIPQLTIAIGRMYQEGKVSSRIFIQMLNSGIPIMEELQKLTGHNAEKIKELGNKGELSFELMQQALKNLTSEGGKFGNLAEKQSRTFNGAINRLKRLYEAVIELFGDSIVPFLTNLINPVVDFLVDGFTKFKEFMNKIFYFIGYILGIIYINYQTYLQPIAIEIFKFINTLGQVLPPIMNFIMEFSDIIIKVALAYGVLIGTIKIFNIVMAISNIIMTANPIGLIIMGIKILIVAIISLTFVIIENWSKIKNFIAKAIKYLLRLFLNFATGIYNTIIKPLLNAFEVVKNFISEFVLKPLANVFDFVKQKIFDWIEGIRNSFADIVNTLKNIIDWISEVAEKLGWKGKVIKTSEVIEKKEVAEKSGSKEIKTTQNNFEVKSDITIQIPEGTPEQQKEFIKIQTKKAVENNWEQMVKKAEYNLPPTS